MAKFITEPWTWYASGALIALNVYILLYLGKKFGISGSLKATCSMLGAGRFASFFNYDWKQDAWLVIYVLGTIIGGFIAFHFMNGAAPVIVSAKTATALNELHIAPNQSFLPDEIFSLEHFSIKKLLILVSGGLLIGFGTRWANGCTSGHAISGLANLQLPSLVAVIGFFIGGLIMTFIFIPLIFK
jgi:uncharacterized membrane protein YedE/YeeE